jgi:cyclic pyranopterin phosphate synthase
VIVDRYHRPLGSLRISVTDRCNLRCRYCMPGDRYRWLSTASLLTFDELERLVRLFASLGVRKLRLTGGEPLLRADLPDLVARLVRVRGIDEVALTTNGTRLAASAGLLRAAGLHRLTVSLDAVDPDTVRAISQRGGFDEVLAGLDAAAAAGFRGTKLNTVVMRGVNDDQLVRIVRFAAERGVEPRFIEYMDVGGATEWRGDLVVPGQEIVAGLARACGGAVPLDRAADPHAPAARWRLGTGVVIGVITSTTAPFCSGCDRARLTADGLWYTCLYAAQGTDLRSPLRAGATDEELQARLTAGWQARDDRGAERRLGLAERAPLVQLARLRDDPHLEMHVRGG